ncbi:putative oxidoreductase YteT [Lampetra fluviatilis]
MSGAAAPSADDADSRRLKIPDAADGEAVPVTVLVIGGGNRGRGYSFFALDFPKRMKVVGIADPRLFARTQFQREHGLEKSSVFTDWREAAELERFADAVFICTPDRLHKDPAVAFAAKGYHVLLEKPMAVSEGDCEAIVAACRRADVMLSVCHVLRYYPPVQKVKELLDKGVIGDVVHIQHLEPVGHFHFAHSFVRGNWRREDESSFSLLAKSCHDLDLVLYWLGGKRCLKVSSFGALCHFTKEHQPPGASSRCVDCALSDGCAYSATKYLAMAMGGRVGWPLDVVCPDGEASVGAVRDALRSGPYGRCVYESDNDVATNQVVTMEFEGGTTASFSMVAFTEKLCVRKTTIYGTKGELHCEGAGPVRVYDFLSESSAHHPAASAAASTRLCGHGGADFFLVDAFISAVAKKEPSLILTGPGETLKSHLLVFAAERARRENRVITL